MADITDLKKAYNAYIDACKSSSISGIKRYWIVQAKYTELLAVIEELCRDESNL